MPGTRPSAPTSNGPRKRAVTWWTALARQLLETLDRHHPAVADDADAVGDALHVVEDVGRQQDRSAASGHLQHHGVELVLHERVEPAGRLVQDEELGIAHQRLDQGQPSACFHARGPAPVVRGPDPDGRRSRGPEPPAPRESRSLARYVSVSDPRQAIPEARLSRHVAGPRAWIRHTVTPRVHPEHGGADPTTDGAGRAGCGWSSSSPAPFGPR